MRSAKKKVSVTLAVVAAVLGAAGVAYAYFTSTDKGPVLRQQAPRARSSSLRPQTQRATWSQLLLLAVGCRRSSVHL